MIFRSLERPKPRSIAHDAAGFGRRAKYWNATSDSINSIVDSEGETLRNRSRDIGRRNPISATARRRYVANIVGTGIVARSQAVDEKIRAAIRKLWGTWVDESDAEGLCDFYGQEALVASAMFEAGEIFARLRPRRASDGLSVPLQVQLLEADHLRNGMNEDLGSGRKIRGGIEFNAIGQRVAYHLYREHPGERFGFNSITTTRVPASEIVQVFEVLRPGQLRGIPGSASALAKLYEIDQYDDGQLARQKLAALFAGFIKKPQDPGFGSEDDAGDDRAKIESFEPATLYELAAGESVEFTEPPSVGDYSEFMRMQARQVAGANDLTYEQLTGDMTQVNYSSARVALLEIRRRHEQLQYGVLCFRFCRPIWDAWINAAVMSGALTIPAGMLADRFAWGRAKFVPAGWQWVDPEKEVKADLTAIRAGLISRSMALAARGYDVEEIDEEIASDNARADRLGLSFDSDGRRPLQEQSKADAQTQADQRSALEQARAEVERLRIAATATRERIVDPPASEVA